MSSMRTSPPVLRRVDEPAVADVDADVREGAAQGVEEHQVAGLQFVALDLDAGRGACACSSARRGSTRPRLGSKTWRVKPLQSKPVLGGRAAAAVAARRGSSSPPAPCRRRGRAPGASQVRRAGVPELRLPARQRPTGIGGRRSRTSGAAPVRRVVVSGRVAALGDGDAGAHRPAPRPGRGEAGGIRMGAQHRTSARAVNRGHATEHLRTSRDARRWSSHGMSPRAWRVSLGSCCARMHGSAPCSRPCCSRRPSRLSRRRPRRRRGRACPPATCWCGVEYSTLNYKDGLAITNKRPVVRSWPMVAGIDGAGTVLESSHPAWKPGDRVVLNGWGVGETRWGCLAERARLKGDWLVRAAGGLQRAPGDGDRHRRLHRDAVRAGAGAPRRHARRRRGAGDRRHRRRRQRRHRLAVRLGYASSPRPARPARPTT